MFVVSEAANVIGVYYLSRDLSPTVVFTLSAWIVLSLVYYPLRKRFLATRGIDLDALTSDPRVFEA